MPFWNLIPWTSFRNRFSPFNRRHVFAAALTSLNTMSLAVFAEELPSSARFGDAPLRTRSRSGLTCAADPSARRGSRRRRAESCLREVARGLVNKFHECVPFATAGHFSRAINLTGTGAMISARMLLILAEVGSGVARMSSIAILLARALSGFVLGQSLLLVCNYGGRSGAARCSARNNLALAELRSQRRGPMARADLSDVTTNRSS
jgi:hypothetical protein